MHPENFQGAGGGRGGGGGGKRGGPPKHFVKNTRKGDPTEKYFRDISPDTFSMENLTQR